MRSKVIGIAVVVSAIIGMIVNRVIAARDCLEELYTDFLLGFKLSDDDKIK